MANTREAILSHPRLNCHNASALSQILNFKRNNLRAYIVRNWAMNIGRSFFIVDYEENKPDSGKEV